MNSSISPNTQAILLLTGPLLTGKSGQSSEPLTLGEYNRLAKILRYRQHEPADLLGTEAFDILKELQDTFDKERLSRLLERGFLLTQALEKWQTRSIWVISRADPEYPARIKSRLKESAPPVFYGCGDSTILNTGGLAIVGSRQIDNTLVEYTDSVGRLAARSSHTVVSGGARGIDQAAMGGALQAGGSVVGVLADNLVRSVLSRELREYLMNNQLVLISPCDPSAGFNVGNAMQRNKIIYALSDAALVVSSDYGKGGTWAGAVEQLDKLHFVPVYVRSNGNTEEGLKALQGKGALPWPNPSSPDAFVGAINVQGQIVTVASGQKELPLSVGDKPFKAYDAKPVSTSLALPLSGPAMRSTTPAEDLFAKVKELILQMKLPTNEAEVATLLQVSKSQAGDWLRRLVDEGVLERKQKPLRYFVSSNRQENLFKMSDPKKDQPQN